MRHRNNYGNRYRRQTQGDKKVPQIIEFVGLVWLLSGIVRLVQRKDRDSNPGYP